MRSKFVILAVAAVAMFFSGCATGFRAGGRNGGVEAGAGVGAQPAPLVIPEGGQTLPPTPEPPR